MRPTGRNEKNESGEYPADWRVSLTIRLGGVPIRVLIPPMLLAKASGIRKRRGDLPAPVAILTMIGSIRATVPVLLTKAPISPVTSITRRNILVSLLPESDITLLPIILASPVWKIPPPTMKRPTIIITVVFENPESPSAGVRTWQRRSARSAQMATRSERTFPLTNNMAETSNIISVAIIVFSKRSQRYYLLSVINISPSRTSTKISASRFTCPSRILFASRFTSSFCMRRLIGRAPYAGS